MTNRDIHLAPKKEQIQSASAHGVAFALVRAQWGKDDSVLGVHADPSSWTTSGFQTTDFLGILGFSRTEGCHIFSGCHSRTVPIGFDFDGFISAFESTYRQLTKAERLLESCGVMLPNLDGLGYFLGHQTVGLTMSEERLGNGHNVSESSIIKKREDDEFEYRLTFVRDATDKGFVIHYRPKCEELVSAYYGVFTFLGVRHYNSCPEFDFEPCFYRTVRTGSSGSFDVDFNSNSLVHNAFEAHTTHFASAVKLLLSADQNLRGFGIPFLPCMHSPVEPADKYKKLGDRSSIKAEPINIIGEWKYDVALSFASSERKYASELCEILTNEGISVFFDEKFAAELWGQDLAAEFDRIFSKEARFCVVFVSRNYRDRMWTRHEFRSILDRTVANRGQTYILPIQIDNTELDGLQSTVGYLHIKNGVKHISDLLIKKIETDKQK